ncbi:hypothetical protein [Saliphagus infecundisoli]|uniref:DUF7967 domain-containing protein n=1 Tax=Saliphagus infecundisoli TaxID=1849069 RepID=A0ABD5QIK4_9EURY|nr:hypothetical protein [Saliphagus infecundisoli]
MTDPDEDVQCWLVERAFDDRNLVTTVYATPDGDRFHRRERSAAAMRAGDEVTAGKRISEDDLEAVTDDDRRERYAEEAARVAADHAPDDPI